MNYHLHSYQFSISWKCLFRSQYWAVENVLSLAVLIVRLPFRLSMCCALCTQPCRGVWWHPTGRVLFANKCFENVLINVQVNMKMLTKWKVKLHRIPKIDWGVAFVKQIQHPQLLCEPLSHHCKLVLWVSHISHIRSYTSSVLSGTYEHHGVWAPWSGAHKRHGDS